MASLRPASIVRIAVAVGFWTISGARYNGGIPSTFTRRCNPPLLQSVFKVVRWLPSNVVCRWFVASLWWKRCLILIKISFLSWTLPPGWSVLYLKLIFVGVLPRKWPRCDFQESKFMPWRTDGIPQKYS